MANLGAKVERVSRNDIVKARSGANFSAEKNDTSKRGKQSKKELPYVLKLKEKDIVDFFTKYGYINHEVFSNDAGTAFIQVNCENFDVIFSDYDVAVNCYPEYASMTSDFDFGAFVKYCKTIDVPVEQAIADIIVADLLTPRFPSYAESRKKHQDEKVAIAYAELPKNMKRLVGSVQEKTLAENKLMENKGKFGTFDAEDFMKTTYGEQN